MRLKEWEGKRLFKDYQIPISEGYLVKKATDAATDFEGEKVVKAQVLSGKRGKSGGIKFATADKIREVVAEMLKQKIQGFPVEEVLVEEKLEVAQEYYLALTVDRGEKSFSLLFSEAGGMDIEETAAAAPERIVRIALHESEFHSAKVDKALDKAVAEGFLKSQIVSLAEKMFRLAQEKDAVLVEINPLILTATDDLLAGDSKIVIDDNALFRQKGFKVEGGLSAREAKARKAALAYVELDGDTAVIGNGAGLVMATLDMVSSSGGRPACFLDIGGGASSEKMAAALKIALGQKSVKRVLINIFGGITRCDEVAEGMVAALAKVDLPTVVRMTGTNAAAGRKILEKAGMKSFEGMEEAVKAVVKVR